MATSSLSQAATPAPAITPVTQAEPVSTPPPQPIPQSHNIGPDADLREDFSEFADDPSKTTSLTSAIFNYTYENGRRYHVYRAGKYLLPNDEIRQDRLDIVRIWAIDMGDLYPSAQVIDTNLSPIQPAWVPPNVEFMIDDATSDWTFPAEGFDFIHARTLGGSIHDQLSFLWRCYRHIKPGGKFEIAKGRTNFFCNDGTLPEDSYMKKWLDEFQSIGMKLGLKFDIILDIPKIPEDLAFAEVKQHNRIVPLESWPKDRALKKIGAFFCIQFMDMGLEAYTVALFTRNGWTDSETQILLAHVREEIRSNKMHIYTYCSYVTATKPKVGS